MEPKRVVVWVYEEDRKLLEELAIEDHRKTVGSMAEKIIADALEIKRQERKGRRV